MSSSLSISERPSMPISLARSCNSPLVSSSYSDVVPPRLPAAERSVFAILAAFSLLAPSSRSFSYCSSSLMLGPWSLAICSPFKDSRSLSHQVEKVHPHQRRLSLETIHSTKRLRSRLTRLASRPSMNFGDGSRATAPASEHGPSSIDITSLEVLRRVSSALASPFAPEVHLCFALAREDGQGATVIKREYLEVVFDSLRDQPPG